MGKQLAKDVLGLTGTGLVLGVGIEGLSKAGAPTGGLETASGFMPLMGTTMGATAVIRQTKKLKKAGGF